MSLQPQQKSPIPRRSALYMPGANARALEKARMLDADCLLLDLEDAVAPDAKAQARNQICDALRAGGYGTREVVVRINGLDTPWGHDDLAALGELCENQDAAPDAILAPKISTAADIEAVCAHLPDGVALWIMIETPAAIFNLDALAARAGDTPLVCFVMGTNDLAKEMQATLVPGRAPLMAALSLSVLAARRYGLCVLDGVFNDIADADAFAQECRQGMEMGFDGKTLIHPSQLAPCNAIFAPDEAEIEQARAVAAAFDDPANAGQGVLKVNGKMTELLHLDIARQKLAIAEAIAARAES
jgi:citrate lyase subunit beta/citryl-CoA lyase